MQTSDVKHINSCRPQAAKEYTCSICGWKIEQGEKHIRHCFKDSTGLKPRIVVMRYHLRCPEVLHD